MVFYCFPVNSSCSDSSSVGSQKEGGSPASGRDPRRSSGSTSYSQVEWTRAQWCNDAKGHVVTRPQLHEKPLPETVLMGRTWNVRCLFRNTTNVKRSSLPARPLDGGVFYMSVSSVAPETASIPKEKYVFKEAECGQCWQCSSPSANNIWLELALFWTYLGNFPMDIHGKVTWEGFAFSLVSWLALLM